MFDRVPVTNEDVWRATFDQWKSDALAIGEEGVFLSADIEQQLNGLKVKKACDKDIYCYFLVKKGNMFASSLLEVAHAMPNSSNPWLKLLDITLQPSLLPLEGKTTEALKETFLVLGQSIVHVIGLTFDEHPSTKLKIYGRTAEMRNLFAAIISTGILDSALEALHLSAALEGNWLVLTKI